MTTDTGSSPAAAPETDSGSSGSGGQAQPLGDRVEKIEQEQQRQGGILDEIKQRLTGGGASSSSSASPPADSGAGSIAEQVRRGVQEIEERRQREQRDRDADAADKTWKASVETRLTERRPAAPGATGIRARISRAMFGPADQ